jgi:hypothetical protein
MCIGSSPGWHNSVLQMIFLFICSENFVVQNSIADFQALCLPVFVLTQLAFSDNSWGNRRTSIKLLPFHCTIFIYFL